MVLCDEYYVLVKMSTTTINIMPLNCYKYLLKITKYYTLLLFRENYSFALLLFDMNTLATSQNSCNTSVLRCPYAFFIFAAIFSIHLLRSQANQPAAHLTSRSFICIFAELFTVYSSSPCIREDPSISHYFSPLIYSLSVTYAIAWCFYEMLTKSITFHPRLTFFII